MKNEVLIEANIFWKKHPVMKRYFYFENSRDIVLLRINNFPEEPLYTLINGLDIVDIDDKPSGWKLDF